MRPGKGLQGTFGEIKTFHSQLSNIDLFSKLESSFLQKFFKYNLSDYFLDIFANVYEDVFAKKINNKLQKSICSSLFLVNESFLVEQFQEKLQKFYRNKSKSISEGELPYAFKFKYCNKHPTPNMIRQNQFIFIEVRIKAEVEKIQEFPQKIANIFYNFQNKLQQPSNKNSCFQKILRSYNMEYFTIFLVYFGDSNFNIFNKRHYEQFNKITLFGKTYKVRLFVFFISRQALIQCFRTINKINNLQYINDLVIQFYELKRQKQRKKRNRDQIVYAKNVEQYGFSKYSQTIYKVVAVVTLVGFGAIVKKIFF